MLSGDLTRLLFERGSFGPHDSAMTAAALRAGAPGLVGVGLVRVLSSAFFAIRRPRVPVLCGSLALVAGAFLSLALMGPPEPGPAWWGGAALRSVQEHLAIADLGHVGLSLSTAISSSANALLLFGVLVAVLPRMDLGVLAKSLLRHGAASLLMAAGIAAWGTMAGSWSFGGGLALRVLGAVGLGAALYLLAAALLGSREVRELLRGLSGSTGLRAGS